MSIIVCMFSSLTGRQASPYSWQKGTVLVFSKQGPNLSVKRSIIPFLGGRGEVKTSRKTLPVPGNSGCTLWSHFEQTEKVFVCDSLYRWESGRQTTNFQCPRETFYLITPTVHRPWLGSSANFSRNMCLFTTFLGHLVTKASSILGLAWVVLFC